MANEHEPFPWLRAWVATNLSSTVYASAGVSLGAVMSLVAPHFGANQWTWFFLGTCIPPSIMAMIFSSDFMFEMRLAKLKRWRELGLISTTLYDEAVRRAMNWRADRLHGKTTEKVAQNRPRKLKTKERVAQGLPQKLNIASDTSGSSESESHRSQPSIAPEAVTGA